MVSDLLSYERIEIGGGRALSVSAHPTSARCVCIYVSSDGVQAYLHLGPDEALWLAKALEAAAKVAIAARAEQQEVAS